MNDGRMQRWRPVAAALLLNVIVPLGAYYGLRAVGVGALVALLVGAVATALRTVWTAVRRRRIDALGAVVLLMMGVSVVLTATTGDPRVLLARDSWGTGFMGVWLLGSLWSRRPAIPAVGTEVMPADKVQVPLEGWRTEPQFRTNVGRISALWGGAFLLDAVVRVWMAFPLPVDTVPGASSMVMIGLLVVTATLSRSMVRSIVHARADA
jgi:hypothetical protein